MVNYREYIQSQAWRDTRERYWASNLSKDCYVCGAPRHSGMHLHHRTYKNLGHERLMDLVPLYVRCHDYVHRLHRTEERWKRKGIWYATKHARKERQR